MLVIRRNDCQTVRGHLTTFWDGFCDSSACQRRVRALDFCSAVFEFGGPCARNNIGISEGCHGIRSKRFWTFSGRSLEKIRTSCYERVLHSLAVPGAPLARPMGHGQDYVNPQCDFDIGTPLWTSEMMIKGMMNQNPPPPR